MKAEPSPEELAALVTALQIYRNAAGAESTPVPSPRSRWRESARAEALHAPLPARWTW